jgi:hypothetical protein
LGLGISFGLAFEKRARDVVEQKLEAHAEPFAVAFHQVGAQGVFLLAELIEGAVEPGVVDLACADAE